MRKIRNKKWFAKATALLISALLLITMLPQAVMAADSDPADQANMPDVTIEEEANAEEAVDDAVDTAIVSESNAEETAAAEDAATITGAESVASAGSGESDESGVTSIQVGTIELVEGVDGYSAGESAPNPDGSWTHYEYFRYSPSYSKTARVTVTYNGQKYTGSFSEVSNQISQLTGQYCYFSFGDDQSYTNQWEVGKEYDVTISLMDKTVPAKVKIIPSPISSFQIDPIEIMEGNCGYQRSEGMSGEKSYFYYELYGMNSSNLNAKVTVVYDGQEYTGNFSEVNSWIYQKTGKSAGYTVITDQSYDNPWMAGNTYDATVTLMGKSTSVKVKILPSPVTSIQVEPIEIIEGTNGSERSRSGMPSEGDSYFHYELSSSLIKKITLIYNGSEYTGNFNEISNKIFQSTGQAVNLNISFSSNQSYENQWKVGNEYDASVRIMGKTAPVKVKIVPSPLSSMQVETIELIEGTNGYLKNEWGPSGPQGEYYYYEPLNSARVNATVTYDGKEYKGSFSAIASQISNITGVNYSFSVLSDQSYENQWKVGNAYDATVKFMGKTAPVKVKIVPSPISSIQVETIELIEGIDGYTTSEWGPYGQREYYLYRLPSSGNTEVTVTYAGEEYTGSFNEVASQIRNITGVYYNFSLISDQSYEKQWTVGNTYDASVSFMGKTAPVKVRIIPNPLESIHIDDLTMSEGAFQLTSYDSMNVPYLYYSSIPSDTEVTLVYSGKEYKEKYSALSSLMYSLTGQYYTPTFNSGETAGNQWQANHTYPATVYLNGKKCTFNVTVVKSPFIDLEAEDIEVIEGVDGYDRGDWYRFTYSPVVTVTTKTGEKITTSNGSLEYNGESFYVSSSDDQSINQWKKGPHTATAQVGGLRTDFTVNVVETPVDKIIFNSSLISIYEEMIGVPEYLLNYTVYFKDGTSIDVSGSLMDYKGKSYSLSLSVPEMKAGERKTATAKLMGKETTVDVECLAMESIELVESDGLKLRIKRADGSIDEHKAYCILTEYNRPYWRLFTDKGQFAIDYDYTGDYENMSISILDNNGTEKQKSNQLKNSKWLKTALHTSEFDSLRYGMNPTILAFVGFNGKITKDNIDVIATVVLLSEQLPNTTVNADLIKSKIKERFAVSEDFDMSLSPNYNPATNTIALGGTIKKGEAYSLEVISTDKEQGFWMHNIANGFDTKIVFDKDYKIASINGSGSVIKGDVNGDKAVDAKDLTTLAKHVAKIATITDAGLLKAADVNSDGTVDAKDLTHLAKYVAKIIPEL